MSDHLVLVGLVLGIVWLLINLVILRRKNRPGQWSLLGFVIGPISVLICVLLKPA